MSSKKKKNRVSWVQCDLCEAIFSDKDVAEHSVDCRCCDNSFTSSFILHSSLYCFVTSFSTKDPSLQYVNEDDYENIVILSQCSLQLCGIPVGDPVVLSFKGEKYVRRSWKGNDKPQLSAALFESDLLYEKAKGCPVIISALTQETFICREVVIDPINSKEQFDKRTLSKIQQVNSYRIFTMDNLINITYFGKVTTCRITELLPCNGNKKDGAFYLALPETIWREKEEAKGQCSPLIDSVGGLQNVIDEIEDVLNILTSSNSSIPAYMWTHGIILHGNSGTGKSLLIRAIAEKWSNKFKHFHMGQSDGDLEECLKQAKANSPAMITIDDLDVICSKTLNRGEVERHPTTVLASAFDSISGHQCNKTIVVIATCNDLNKVDKTLRRPGRFDKEIEAFVPNAKERLKILQVLLRNISHNVDNEGLNVVADTAHGFVGADLVALISNAVSRSFQSDKPFLQSNDLLRSLAFVRPSALREVMIQVPDTKWEDIGGQDHLKHKLRQAIEWPLKYSESFTRLGITPPRGVLMYGPPGCSKTMIAKALATETGLNFISVKGPELFSKWVGESEKAVRQVFRKARQSAPCIVFFDELDALAGERSMTSGGAQVQERVLAQLLTELDGVEALGHVIVVGATNRPDRIDAALLRPGRLDRVIHVTLPDHRTRADIFRLQFRKTPVSEKVFPDNLASLTEGYSGAEVVAVCHEAALNALDNNMEASVVSMENFEYALRVVTPRTPKSALAICEQYAERSNKRI